MLKKWFLFGGAFWYKKVLHWRQVFVKKMLFGMDKTFKKFDLGQQLREEIVLGMDLLPKIKPLVQHIVYKRVWEMNAYS